MVDFAEHVLRSSQKAEAFMAELGGLPEISSAAANLITALDQTEAEIGEAVFASRFPNPPSEYFRSMTGSMNFSPDTLEAIKAEGEAGLKRSQLGHQLQHVRHGLMRLINDLVLIRADLKVSQSEFDED